MHICCLNRSVFTKFSFVWRCDVEIRIGGGCRNEAMRQYISLKFVWNRVKKYLNFSKHSFLTCVAWKNVVSDKGSIMKHNFLSWLVTLNLQKIVCSFGDFKWIHVVSSTIRLTYLETTSSSFVTSHGLYGSSLYLVSRLSFIPSRIWEIPLTDMKLSGLVLGARNCLLFSGSWRSHLLSLRGMQESTVKHSAIFPRSLRWWTALSETEFLASWKLNWLTHYLFCTSGGNHQPTLIALSLRMITLWLSSSLVTSTIQLSHWLSLGFLQPT